ncbi:MAG: hypothetical protein LBU04_01135 [Christensenellaceae bacterium]|nr:hypothetical protein [Christensenellaceae bacterium]
MSKPPIEHYAPGEDNTNNTMDVPVANVIKANMMNKNIDNDSHRLGVAANDIKKSEDQNLETIEKKQYELDSTDRVLEVAPAKPQFRKRKVQENG